MTLPNIERAIEHFEMALKVMSREGMNFIKASVNLSRCYLDTSDWKKICQVCPDAENIGDNLIALAVGEENQAKYLSNMQSLFRNHSYALAKKGKNNEALAVLEKGKTRSLNQALFLQRIKPSKLEPEIRKKISLLQQKILGLERQLYVKFKEDVSHYNAFAQKLRKRQDELRKIVKPLIKKLSLQDTGKWDIQKALGKCQKAHTALVVINMTPVGTVLLVSIPPQKELNSIFLDTVTDDDFFQLAWQDPENSSDSGWLNVFPHDPEKEDVMKIWSEEQPKILAKLGQLLWPQLDAFLQKEKIERIILIPQGDLFLYPLHATPFIPKNTVSNDPVYPLERYTITYTPSLQVYEQVAQVNTLPLKGKRFLFAENPGGDLDFSLACNEKIPLLLKNRNITLVSIRENEVTENNLLKHFKKSHFFHFYGHAHHNPLRPEESGLMIYSQDKNNQCFTLETMREKGVFSTLYMAVLMGCETGMSNIWHSHWRDQYIGLPASFLRAGTKIVIGSLWPVPEAETCLLFNRFYEELLNNPKVSSPAEALREAQLWMLRAKRYEIRKAEKIYLGIEPEESALMSAQASHSFSDTACWGAFYIVGNGFVRFE